MSVIKPNMVLVDRRGHEWRTAPNYQDREPYAAGWLLLRSSIGEELPFADVVELYGYRDADDKAHLRGYCEAPTQHPRDTCRQGGCDRCGPTVYETLRAGRHPQAIDVEPIRPVPRGCTCPLNARTCPHHGAARR